jgi:prophage regulatory protein
MKRTQYLQIERKSEVLQRIGLSRSTLHSKVQNGLWCPPISLGARAVGFIKYETDELITGLINGHTPDEIRDLVRMLLEERKSRVEGES